MKNDYGQPHQIVIPAPDPRWELIDHELDADKAIFLAQQSIGREIDPKGSHDGYLLVPQGAPFEDRAHKNIVTIGTKHDAEHEYAIPVEQKARRFQINVKGTIE